MVGRKIIACVTVIMLFLTASLSAVAENSDIDSSNTSLALASECKLTFDKENCEISVLSADGFAWQSSPVAGGTDALASGAERTNQRSMLLISYLDAEGNVSEVSSYVASFKKNGMSVEETKSGLELTYEFNDLGISIPLALKCVGNYFEASIKTSEIKETGDNKLLTVSILPYFGAGAVSEDGYVFIPDGSGALISLDKTKAYTKTYEKSVYGENALLYKKTESTVEEQIYLPVFGIKRGSNAMLGIITEGDAVSSITANALTGFYTAAAKFIYRQVDTSHLMEGSSKEKVVSIAPKTATLSDFSVRYMFLQGEKANYIGMAEIYRNYLAEKYELAKDKKAQGKSLDISFTATAETDESFLGIPYKGLTAFTTLSDVENIFDYLKNENINNYNTSLSGAFQGGTFGKVTTKVSLAGKVGKISEYEELKSKIEAEGGNLALLTNFQRAYKTGNGVSKNGGTARDVGGAIKQIYNYYPESFGENEERGWYLLNTSALKKVTEKFIKSAKKYDLTLGLTDMANEIYGDYHLNAIDDRAAVLDTQLAVFDRLHETVGDIYFQNANIYALKYADMISDIPTRSSQYDLFTEDVPFYQAVIHGLIDYSSSAINLSGDFDAALLKCLEYGSAIRYDLICRNTEEIFESSANDLISADKDVWLEKIIETEKEISDFYRSNAECSIAAHTKLADGVYRTDYSNGNSVVVNYNAVDFDINGSVVKANGYLFTREGE